MDYVAIPKDFLKVIFFVALVVDVMFVNVAPFLITMSHGTKSGTNEHIPTHIAKQLSKYLKRFMTIYSRSGMIVQTVLVNMEFDKVIYKPIV